MSCPYMKGSTGQFKSTVTGKEYQVLGDNMLNCASKNVVYLTSCVKCGVQYIGKTIQVLSKRQNLNRNQGKGHIEKYGVPHVSCRRLIEHFYGGKECNETHIRVQPIEQVTLEKGMEEKTMKEKAAEIDLRLGRAECRWMKKMRTVYPYGLNDKMEGKQKGGGTRSVEMLFVEDAKNRNKARKRGKGKKKVEQVRAEEVYDLMMKEGISPGWQNRLRLAVYKLVQTEIRRLMQILEHTRRVKTTCKTMVLHCVIDMLKTRGTKELKEVIKKEKPRVVWKLNYLSEGTSLIRIGRLLREKDAVNAVPAEAETKAPVVVFEHTSTVRKELLNHKKALRELTEIDWNGERDGPCVCEKYTNKKHKVLKHVITGEFEGMIKSAELRELLAKGSGHREPQPVDWEREES
jgi:hypothetical protein